MSCCSIGKPPRERMTAPLTVADLFDTLQTRLALAWAAGQNGRRRTIRYQTGDDRSNISLVGHLNFIHPNRVQVNVPGKLLCVFVRVNQNCSVAAL